jgi:2-dehydro-3-deoxyphosphogluconate aldolase / (4S)-4-hydroxy-2-oxoglutarate aldolase
MAVRRDEALDVILATKVIAVIRMSNPEKLGSVTDAIVRGGVRAVEITMTTPDALNILQAMSAKKARGVLVGAGTVLDAGTAKAALAAGADFVVSPILDLGLIRVCRAADVFVAAGGLTPTEIVTAWNAGADVVKVFPATSVGPKYFRDLKGPFPNIRLMPTGGVDAGNAADFIKNGACAVAVGTALLDPVLIGKNDWATLEKNARALVESLARV